MTTASLHIEKIVAFEELYLSLRKKEQRIYTDAEIRQLPDISARHPHYTEWKLRKRTTARLLDYILKRKTHSSILEVGCGNGWLSHRLSCYTTGHVTGIDVNGEELEAAERVFGGIKNLKFYNADIREGFIPGQGYDLIVFAASIQYFPVLAEVIEKSLSMLNPGGEIHVLDSHFYKKKGLNDARKRSAAYFNAIGFPSMVDHYFHHDVRLLDAYDHRFLHDPLNVFHKIFNNYNPFYWAKITGAKTAIQ